MNWILIIVGLVMILLELILGGFAGFDLVLLGSALALGGGAGLMSGRGMIGVLVAAVLSVAYIVAGRRWVRARLHHRGIPSNADALIGKEALVLTPISEHVAGQVRILGEVWRALPDTGSAGPLESGQRVTVMSIEGVTLYVAPVHS